MARLTALAGGTLVGGAALVDVDATGRAYVELTKYCDG